MNVRINNNFRPSQPRSLTSSSIFSIYPRAAIATSLSSFSSVLTQVNPEAQVRINSYHKTTTESYQTAEIISKKLDSFKRFILDLENPNISNEIFVLSFKQQVGMGLFKKICEEVSLAMTGSKNVETGEHLLNENFRATLRIRDYDGRTLLDQIAGYYAYQLENYRERGELNNLGEILEKYSDLVKRAVSIPTSLGTTLYEEAAKLKLSAIKMFQSLPSSAKGSICYEIYVLDGADQKDLDYGYKTILNDIQKSLYHKGLCPIKEAAATCAKNFARSPVFVTSYLHVESIKPMDSKAIIEEIKKLYELEDLKHFLNDPYKNNDFLESKYRKLSPGISFLLNRSIWLACYQPKELGFSENFISEHVRILLEIKNQQGMDIISQLITHQQEKIKGLRLIDEMQSFILAAPKQWSPQRLLELFNRLSDKAKEDLRERVWRRDGGENNPHVCGWQNFFGQWGWYGTRKIEADPHTLLLGQPHITLKYILDLKEKINSADSALLEDLELSKRIPETPIDVSASKLEREPGLINHLPPNLRIACVTSELAGVASLGGLAPAVDGILQAFGPESARVIMPLYKGGHIPDNVLGSIRAKPKYTVEVNQKQHLVFSTLVNGIKCYFIDDPHLFSIPKKSSGASGDFYKSGDYLTIKRRWAVFQSAAAKLVYKLSKKKHPIQLVHAHEAQAALVPTFLATDHPKEWKRGKTPATLFTFHNNYQAPGAYDNESTIEILQQHGLARKSVNSFTEALSRADMVTTVSKTFGKEAQTELYGNAMNDSVKRAALTNRLVGIVNGNSNGWNPAKDEQLRNWKPVQGEPMEQTIDLRFSPDSPDLVKKIKTCQLELCAYLKSLPFDDDAYADLDPEKPIVTYIGRYDWSQKGVDKFFLVMEETLKNGGQFVCVGLEPTSPEAEKMLEDMKRYARERGKKGVLILEDQKENEKLKYQKVFGSLLRAATSAPICPSIYEPCGLVQGEFNRFGKKVIATQTGGFVDTLKTEGPDANGYLFKRHRNWFSAEQDRELVTVLEIALSYAKAMQHAFYHGNTEDQKPFVDSMRTIMRNALNSTWERTLGDDSLSPIRYYELAMAKAFEYREKRNPQFALSSPLNLNTVKL